MGLDRRSFEDSDFAPIIQRLLSEGEIVIGRPERTVDHFDDLDSDFRCECQRKFDFSPYLRWHFCRR